jgi:hypothetical protein
MRAPALPDALSWLMDPPPADGVLIDKGVVVLPISLTPARDRILFQQVQNAYNFTEPPHAQRLTKDDPRISQPSA